MQASTDGSEKPNSLVVMSFPTASRVLEVCTSQEEEEEIEESISNDSEGPGDVNLCSSVLEDVTEQLGLQSLQQTLACGMVAPSIVAQVCGREVRLCSCGADDGLEDVRRERRRSHSCSTASEGSQPTPSYMQQDDQLASPAWQPPHRRSPQLELPTPMSIATPSEDNDWNLFRSESVDSHMPSAHRPCGPSTPALTFESKQAGTTCYSVAGDDKLVLASVSEGGWIAVMLSRSQTLVLLAIDGGPPQPAASPGAGPGSSLSSGSRKRGRCEWRLVQEDATPLAHCQLSCLHISTSQCFQDARAAWLLAGGYDGSVTLFGVSRTSGSGADSCRLDHGIRFTASQLAPPLQRTSPPAAGRALPGMSSTTPVPESLLVIVSHDRSYQRSRSAGGPASGEPGGGAGASSSSGSGGSSFGPTGLRSSELLFLVGWRNGSLSLHCWSLENQGLQTLSYVHRTFTFSQK